MPAAASPECPITQVSSKHPRCLQLEPRDLVNRSMTGPITALFRTRPPRSGPSPFLRRRAGAFTGPKKRLPHTARPKHPGRAARPKHPGRASSYRFCTAFLTAPGSCARSSAVTFAFFSFSRRIHTYVSPPRVHPRESGSCPGAYTCCTCAQSRWRCRRVSPVGGDAGGGAQSRCSPTKWHGVSKPSPGADAAGVSPVPVQMWHRVCRDWVSHDGVSPVPVQMW